MSRRKRNYKRKYVDWVKEINKGHVKKFYDSADWAETRAAALSRDRYICQYYLGEFEQYGHKADTVRLVKATTVHHIKPLKEYPELCLDLDNLVSLSHEAHEIIEGRTEILSQWAEKNKKKPLTKERW